MYSELVEQRERETGTQEEEEEKEDGGASNNRRLCTLHILTNRLTLEIENERIDSSKS